ncbi:alpha-galactosidase, partial [Lactobacillus sp. HMSC077C11]
SPAQKPACKDLERNGQSPAITLKATYTPVSNRAGSRSQKSRLDHVELIKAAFLTYTTMANNYLTCFGVP